MTPLTLMISPGSGLIDPHLSEIYSRVTNTDGLDMVSPKTFESARVMATGLVQQAAEGLAAIHDVSWTFASMPDLGSRRPSIFTSTAGADAWSLLRTIIGHNHSITPGLCGTAISSLIVLSDYLDSGIDKASIPYRLIESLHAVAAFHVRHGRAVHDARSFARSCVELGPEQASTKELESISNYANFPLNDG